MRCLRIILPALGLGLFWVWTALAAPPYPKVYPDVFPQHPQCQMVQIMDFKDNKSAMLSCGKTPPTQVFGFYHDRAAKAGWRVRVLNKSDDYKIFMARKDGLVMQVQVGSEKGVTQLGLSLVQAQKR